MNIYFLVLSPELPSAAQRMPLNISHILNAHNILEIELCYFQSLFRF